MRLVNIYSVCLVALVAFHISEVMGACCHAVWGVCADCTPSTPYCGYRRCNFWGCNCGGGCRTGPCHRRKRSTLENRNVEELVTLFKTIDTNKDDKVTRSEMASSGFRYGEADFASVDVNNDGDITLNEVENIH